MDIKTPITWSNNFSYNYTEHLKVRKSIMKKQQIQRHKQSICSVITDQGELETNIVRTTENHKHATEQIQDWKPVACKLFTVVNVTTGYQYDVW
jgi:hypothetical protein